MAKERIIEFFDYCKKNNLEQPVISFSGGKDSCVLKHMVRTVVKNTTCIVAGELFNPDNSLIIRQTKNKEIYRPIKSFDRVITEYGFPMISKEVSQKINSVRNCKKLGNWVKASLGLKRFRMIPNKYLHMLDKKFVDYEISHVCCSYIKGSVKHDKRPKFVGTTIQESQLRKTNWIRKGCNVFDARIPMSRPISLFTSDDVFKYAKIHRVKLSKAYKKGWERTGCLLCGFGLQFECSVRDRSIESNKKNKKIPIKYNRLELLKKNYPNIYEKYIWKKCMYRPLMDSYVTITNDERYMKKYAKRQLEIEKWYKNKKHNLKKIIKQIEKQTNSKFSKEELKKLKSNYLRGEK